MSDRARAIVFAALAAAVVAAIVVFVAIRAKAARKVAPAPSDSAAVKARADLGARTHVLFRSLDLEPSDAFGHLEGSALEPSDAPERATSARLDTSTPCMRVHFARRAPEGQRVGLCFEADVAPDEHGSTAILRGLDAAWSPTWSKKLDGIPSRLRVSPHGKVGAATIFVTGHGYDDATMSTMTILVDMATGETIADLESFDIRRGDEPLKDGVNLWGVTFAQDDETFYVTVARGASTWLAKGTVASRALRTLREGVECPSLSPDEKTIVFKKRGADRTHVRLHTMDVATLEDRPLPGEDHVIDDQAEWLDARTVLYKQGADVWAADVDGKRAPRVFLERASSPAVVER